MVWLLDGTTGEVYMHTLATSSQDSLNRTFLLLDRARIQGKPVSIRSTGLADGNKVPDEALCKKSPVGQLFNGIWSE
jgi:hypothetical protein